MYDTSYKFHFNHYDMDSLLDQSTAPGGASAFHRCDDTPLISADLVISDLQSYIGSPDKYIFSRNHPFYQIVYFTTAHGHHIIDFKKQLTSTACTLHHGIRQADEWELKSAIDGMVINFSELFFGTFLANVNYVNDLLFMISNNGESHICICEEDQSLVEELMKQIRSAFHGEHPNYDLTRIHLLHLMIKLNMRLMSGQASRIGRHYYLTNFEVLIEKHFLSKRFPKDYAKLLFITPNHLNAICIQFAGKSAGDMIRSRVLLEAKRLLLNSSLTISEIASYLNFETHSYFSRFFKKEENISPESFKKNYTAS